MDTQDLRVIAELTIELTKLRQSECKHLCIENFAPELFRDLVAAYTTGEVNR